MFTPQFYIDSFQGTKKALTNAVITDPTLNKAAHAYIDAQTAFAKVLVNNTIDISRTAFDSATKVLFPQKDSAA